MSGKPPEPYQPKPAPRRGRRIFRAVFRWGRIAVLLALLLAVVLGLFLNKVGLPEPIKRRVIAGLRAQGWDVQFSRLRLHWYRGVVAEDLQLHRTNQLGGPNIFVEEAECRFNSAALKRFKIEVDSVALAGGRLIWPLPAARQPTRNLLLENIVGELRFKPNDEWELRSLRAKLLGARLQLSGVISNASTLRDWKFPKRPAPAPPDGETVWRRALTELKKVRFTGQPELIADFDGDARDLKSFSAGLRFIALQADSPWGRGTNLFLRARLAPPPRSNDPVRAEVKLTVDAVHTPWAEAATLELDTLLEPSWTHLFPTNASVTAELRSARTRWGQARRVNTTVHSQPDATNAALRQTQIKLVAHDFQRDQERAARAEIHLRAWHPATNYLPAEVWTEARLTGAETRWAAAPWVKLDVHALLPPTNQFRLWQTNLLWTDRLENIPLELSASLTNLSSPKLKLERLSLTNHWRSPGLLLEVAGDLYDGHVATRAALNVTNGEVIFGLTNDFEIARLWPLLATNTQRALADFTWQTPPRLEAEGKLVLPAWTNRPPDWSSEVWPALTASGRAGLGHGAFRGVSFTSAEAAFALTNLLWRVPALQLTRPEGAVAASGEFDQRTRAFLAIADSGINLKSLKPIFPRKWEQRVFDFFEFTVPPQMQAEFRGRWGNLKSIAFKAGVQMTNGSFRGEWADGCTARVDYTNLFVSVLEPHLWRTNWHGTADGLGIDLGDERLWLTNARGTIDPYALTRAIGPPAARAIEPFRFATPPTGRASGMVDLTARRHDDNMRFEVEGGPFQWLHFHLDHVKGGIHWQGDRVALTNVTGSVKGAGLAGDARFDFSQGASPIFSFNLALVEADLKALGTNLVATTNRLEGWLDGTLAITSARGNDPQSWQGQGYAHLRDGLIWEIPIFGIFSPALDAIAPGLGRSRAKEATGNFTITNGVIHTRDLVIHATAMRMLYRGTVDFDRKVDGRMEAELLRDLPGIGPVMRWIFAPVTKLFIYKVTGTLDQPKKEPLYTIPKVLLMPFQPIKTVKELFGPDEKKPPGNPARKEEP